jgi:type IV secretion system protein VirB10
MNNDKNTTEIRSEELDSLETSSLTDSPKTSKWPWLIAAFIIVMVVLLLQFGLRTGFSALSNKAKSKQSMKNQIAIGDIEAKLLPIPTREKEAEITGTTKSPSPTPNVAQYLDAQKRDETDELARLRLFARLKAHEDKQKEQEAMINSSAVINIGVGVQNKGVQSDENLKKNGDDGYQNPNTQYLKSMSGHGVETVSATMLGDLRFLILKGKRIAGVTESAIDSDLPGIVRGHVTEDVYGAQGDIPLVHNGDELIGEYRSGDIRNGQVTLFVVWSRLRLQSGITVNLDSSGSDPLGRAGMTGNVDNHYMQRYGSALLMSTISAGAATVGVHGEDGYNSLSAFRQGASGAFSQTANQELQKGRQIQNSIRPPQGTEISILVNKDISFENVLTQDENA